ncbi:MAG: GIY-YIG nuclease family protein [Bacteroidota bacterium]
MNIHQYYVYIITTSKNKVLYTGVTNNLIRRCHEHKMGLIKGFTKKYNISKLVYYEVFDHIETAIKREKQIKTITRAKKESLINSFNPEWKELFSDNTIHKPPPDPSLRYRSVQGDSTIG